MTQSTLKLTEKTYKTWPKKLRRPTPDTVEIVQTNNNNNTVFCSRAEERYRVRD